MIKLIKNDKLLQVVGANGTKLLDVTKLLGASFGVNSETAANPTVSFHSAISAQSYPLSEVLTVADVPFANFAALSAFFNSFISSGSGGAVAFSNITGAPTDNLALATEFGKYLRKTAGAGVQTVANDATFNVPNSFEIFLPNFSQLGRIKVSNESGDDTVRLEGGVLKCFFDNGNAQSNLNFWDLIMSANEFTFNCNGVSTFNMYGNAYLNTPYGEFNGQGSGIKVGAGITGQGVELYSIGTAGQIGVLISTQGNFVISTPFGDYTFPAAIKPTVTNLAASATTIDIRNKVNEMLNVLRSPYGIIL